ncbi:MAG: PadR family transcriptional regulator [Candidatus Aenigmatarchaeota archaeon]
MKPLERLEKLNTSDCLWVYILSILNKTPMHAYAVRKEVEKRFGFTPGNVTSYKVLYLLKRNGYVSKSKYGRTIVYDITTDGKKELKKAAGFYRSLAQKLEARK